MLNISHQSTQKEIKEFNHTTLNEVENKVSGNVLRRILWITSAVLFVFLFLPWTQNIRARGYITTLTPNQRPQKINSVIGGQIKKWYVKEGDFVQQGDTILKMAEIKDAYFDAELLSRTKKQIELKQKSIENYSNKIENQIKRLKILQQQRDLKLNQYVLKIQQTKNKVVSDSMAYQTALQNYQIAEYRYQRADSLFKMGLKSLTYLESRKMKWQQADNYRIKAQNEWINNKTELTNLQVEINNLKAKFLADSNKIQSLIFSTQSAKLETETQLKKLEIAYSNYQYRTEQYFLTAPQSGYITKIKRTGINETVKQGEEILTLMPANYRLAVEIYIEPLDLPLVEKGQKVRLQFDGWPAIVFSGWPNVSHGTYGGEIYAIDQYISRNGKYRLLVKPDPDDYPWPEALRFGSGASAMLLLKDVPIWYELWRNINGFPPDFYKQNNNKPAAEKKK